MKFVGRSYGCVPGFGVTTSARYKSVVVDPAEMQYFETLSDYIHPNRARARIVNAKETLADCAWSSFPAYLRKARRPEWLVTELVLGELGMEESAIGRRQYARRTEARAQEGEGKTKKSNRDAGVRRGHAEVAAKRLLDSGLELLGLEAAELERLPRGDERNLAFAALIRNRAKVSNKWTAAASRMGHPSRVTTILKMANTHALRRKFEAVLAN